MTDPTLVAPPGVPGPDGRPWWRRKRFIIPIGVVFALLLIGLLAPAEEDEEPVASDETTTTAETNDADAETTTSEATTTTTAPTTTTTTQPAVPSFGNGKHRVGSDIQPGIYRIADVGSGCYWARLAGFDGELDDILANDNATGSAVVEILPSDAGFESSRCGTWRMDTSRVTDSTTKFGEGTFIVGTDLEPGQWRSTGADGCYWARLSNFQGDLESIIANDNVDGPTIVQIAPSDRGFESTRCGSWEKIG